MPGRLELRQRCAFVRLHDAEAELEEEGRALVGGPQRQAVGEPRRRGVRPERLEQIVHQRRLAVLVPSRRGRPPRLQLLELSWWDGAVAPHRQHRERQPQLRVILLDHALVAVGGLPLDALALALDVGRQQRRGRSSSPLLAREQVGPQPPQPQPRRCWHERWGCLCARGWAGGGGGVARGEGLSTDG